MLHPFHPCSVYKPVPLSSPSSNFSPAFQTPLRYLCIRFADFRILFVSLRISHQTFHFHFLHSASVQANASHWRMHTAFHKAFARDKGVFNGRNIHILTDNISWVHLNMLMVTDQGQLYLADDLGTPYMVLLLLLACLVQILADGASQPSVARRKTRQDDSLLDEPPVLLIRTFDNDRLYLKVLNRTTFGNLLAALMVWQNLRPVGLAKKWYLENRASRSVVSDLLNEVLVCRCKVYGPLPRGAKTVRPVPGPPAPGYLPRGAESQLLDSSTPSGSLLAPPGGRPTPPAGGCFAMGVPRLTG